MPQLKVKKYFHILFSGVLAIFLFSFTFENDPLAQIIASYKRYLAELPEEKIYLHQDRQMYSSGETIWFKAYLTQGPFHQTSTLSSTVYVELIDDQNQLIQREIVYSPDGFCRGQLQLPDSLPTGDYLIRAYTQWMRNFGEEYFFHRPIKIFSEISPPRSPSRTGTELDLQFSPEGGHLVQGILSKVAFKALESNGLGKKVKGKIFEGTREIGSFESNQLGMGIFAILPANGKTYTAFIEGHDKAFPLPSPLESGLVMAVTNSQKSDEVVIKFLDSEKSPGKSVFVVAQSRGLICATGKVDLSNQVAFVRIPKKEFPTGIAQLTALDENGFPLAERLIFIDHQDQLQIKITTDKETYQPREPVRLEIEAKTKEGKPALANLSLRVVDADQLNEPENGTTIRSHLLLTSELKGDIQDPGYYFNPENPDRDEALDYLMLTQGWRKYPLKQALAGAIPEPKFSPEQGITIRGELKNPRTGQSEAGGTVSYLSLYPIAQSITVTSDANGEYEIRDLIFFDSAQVSLHGKLKNGRSTAEVLLDESYELPGIAYPFIPARAITVKQAEDLLRLAEERRRIDEAFDVESRDVTLDEVQVKGKKISAAEEYVGPRIYGGGSAKIQVAGNTALENQQHPMELVRGRVAGVQVSGSGTEWRVLIQGIGSINSRIDPLIMVDDIPIDMKSLNTIPVQEIESFTVWKGPDTAIFGSRGANGAIGFYTKRSKGVSSTTAEQPRTFLQNGYQTEREFYSPKYPVTDPNLVKPDRRVTLFWAPHIQTDSSGRASVAFYNHEMETTVVGEIEGIGASGNSGVARVRYRVGKE